MIGYYVHHHGSGHVTRALTIARRLSSPVTGFSSLARPDGWPGEWIQLPDDRTDRPRDADAGGVFHWAPLGHPGYGRRMAVLASWLSAERPRVMVVDVSVEVSLLARLLGVPVVVVAMRGDRTDRAHKAAYDAASALMAPWTEEHREPTWPVRWLDKTVHVGALSRFDGWEAPPGTRTRPDQVLVLWGAGGSEVGEEQIAAAQAATPDYRWTLRTPQHPSPDVWREMNEAAIVVTHGGQNAVAEVAAARRPAVVVAQERPHQEQLATAAALARRGVCTAVPRWPEPHHWPQLLATARERGGEGWASWNPGNGADVAARFLDRFRPEAPL